MIFFRAFIIATLLLLFAPCLKAQSIDSLVQRLFDAGFSGEVLVAQKGKVKYHEVNGFRSFEQKISLQKGDVYEFASVTKQFTAMVILKLAAAHNLNIDDSLAKFIATPYPGITIRHLLTHTSGLPDYQAIMDRYWDKTKIAGNPEIIEYLNRYAPPALFAPGDNYLYSNTGYVLLASIAEKVTGEDFISLSNRLIFEPLNMTQTHIRTPAEKAAVPNFAAGHLKDSTGQFVNANTFYSDDYTIWLGNRKGPGRVSGTATDLLKWDQALYNPGFIEPVWLNQAFAPARLNDGSATSYGFGWDIKTTTDGSGKIVMHNGDNPGYKSWIVRLLGTQGTLIVLNNNYFPGLAEFIKQVVPLL